MRAGGGDALPSAVVFDCDGTLVDSERLTEDVMREVLAAMGRTLAPHDMPAMVGHTWPHTRAYLVDRFDLTDDEVAGYRASMDRALLPRLADPGLVFDDVASTVSSLHDAGVPMGVCTSSSREHLEVVVSLAPLRGLFAAAVAREDTDRHKPDPLPYLTAIDRLRSATSRDLDPTVVTVVEDSRVGVRAGRAAGCWTVAVDRGARLHDLGEADLVVDRLTVDHLRPRR